MTRARDLSTRPEHVTYSYEPFCWSTQIFSRAGLLSDPNLDPTHLATFVKVAANKKAHKPSSKEIQERYYTKFRCKNDTREAAPAPAEGEAGPSGIE